MNRLSTIPLIAAAIILGTWSSAWALATDGVAAATPNFIKAATYLGPTSPTQQVRLVVHLAYPNPGAVAAFASSVNDLSSLQYGNFVTADQFASAFAPSPTTYNAVILALQGAGFQAVGTYSNRKVVDVVGTVAAANAFFHTVIANYSYNGVTYYANALPAVFPANLKGLVMAASGLNNFDRKIPHFVATSASPSATPTPRPAAYGPVDIQTAYNEPVHVNPAINGTTAAGQHVTIAIETAYDYLDSDIQGFWSHFNIKRTGYVFRRFVDNSSGQGIFNPYLSIETTADLEWSSSMATGANVLVYEARDNLNSTFDDMYEAVVIDPRVDVVTTSWGSCEAGSDPNEMAADNDIFMQGAAQGQTMFAASGDNGSEDCGTNNPPDGLPGFPNPTNLDFPSDSPWVAASGGTTLYLNANKTIASETVWSGTGGGVSTIFGIPKYQLVVTTLASYTKRNSPDFVLDSDPSTGYYLFFDNSALLKVGGTSLVAPNMAPIYAQIDGFYGHRLGLAQTGFYSGFVKGTYPGTVWHDILIGSIGAFSAHAGYDNASGVGSVNGYNYMLQIPHKGNLSL